jgi:hypothetical protein
MGGDIAFVQQNLGLRHVLFSSLSLYKSGSCPTTGHAEARPPYYLLI